MLLLDLGNSRLKWRFTRVDGQVTDALAWEAFSHTSELVSLWGKYPRPEVVLGASVATSVRRGMIDRVLRHLDWPGAAWLQSPARRGGVSNAYLYPSSLGIDRFLLLLAAHDAGLGPCVIASCGSAVTLDALGANGCHVGGQILPGLNSMKTAVHLSAPGLAGIGTGQIKEFAMSTSDAVQTGVQSAIAGSIERFADAYASRLQQPPSILLSGGDGARIGALLRRDWRLFEHAVLRGLEVWAGQDS